MQRGNGYGVDTTRALSLFPSLTTTHDIFCTCRPHKLLFSFLFQMFADA